MTLNMFPQLRYICLLLLLFQVHAIRLRRLEADAPFTRLVFDGVNALYFACARRERAFDARQARLWTLGQSIFLRFMFFLKIFSGASRQHAVAHSDYVSLAACRTS